MVKAAAYIKPDQADDAPDQPRTNEGLSVIHRPDADNDLQQQSCPEQYMLKQCRTPSCQVW